MSSQYSWPRRKTIPRVKEARLSNSYSTINGDSGQVQADPESTINITGAGGISVTATEGSPDSLSISGAGVAAVSHHHSLLGLGDDDHTSYHTDGRALTWLGTRSTSDLSEGTNLYYTDERAQDAIGAMVSNEFTYTDATPELALNYTNIHHHSLTGLADDDHTQYHNDSRALTWLGTRSTTDLPEGTNLYWTTARGDARYYTETELDAGQLDNRYYTETELDAGQLDNRYYTETELDAGQLDNRYYTEAESDAAFAPIAKGVTNGDSHDHSGGDGAQIDHTTLSNIGTNTHAQIDTHIAAAGNYLLVADIDDTPVNGETAQPISSNWAFDHDADTDAHHAESHTVASHSDTSATGAELNTLTDNSLANTLHRHSELVASDGSPDPALSVDASGNVGIGTTGPSEKLQVHDGNVLFSDWNSTNTLYLETHANTQTDAEFIIRKAKGGAETPTACTLANDNLGSIRFQGYDGSSWITGAMIRTRLTGVPSTNNMPTRLEFYTNSGAASETEKMRIDSDGDVGIGTASPSYKLEVNGTLGVQGTVTAPGLSTSTGTNLVITGSDEIVLESSATKYKENMVPLENTAFIYDLEPTKFNFIADPDKTPVYGLMAEEVEAINPDIVRYRHGELESVHIASVNMAMLKEVQVLRAEITELKARIEALEEENEQ